MVETQNSKKRDWLGDLASRLHPVFEKHRGLHAIVFGSLARREASRQSDLDLIPIWDTDKRFLSRSQEVPLTLGADRWQLLCKKLSATPLSLR
jgi:predicted nucleotidyltransferase